MEFPDDWTFAARTVFAMVLGFIIGWERETQGSPAGDRTYAMVALGASAFTCIAQSSFPNAPDRLVAGVITGVGFLGAGLILRDGGTIRGLTSAAGIWAVASIGVSVGAGEYVFGLFLAALVLLVLMWERLPVVRGMSLVRRHIEQSLERSDEWQEARARLDIQAETAAAAARDGAVKQGSARS
ncbi:MAG TPA: MgtC/SapB family protein [Dehalococcoidia bacterium]|nr:MgtC/SapB family protein [Dehalococcoidia bacterium]